MTENIPNKNRDTIIPLPRFYIIDKRSKLGLSAEEVSRLLNVTKRYYYQIENGWRGKRMGVPLILKLIKILDMDAKEFLESEDEHITRFKGINKIKEKC